MFIPLSFVNSSRQAFSKAHFFKEVLTLANFRTIGAVAPSSGSLTRAMASFVHPDARVVVEFGAGTGNTTTAILQNLPLNAKLISFEIHPPFIAALRAIKDKRLLIIDDVAQNASDHLRRLEIYTVDSIVSSLPLRVIPELEREAILSTAKDILADDGNFIQFLYWFGKNPPLKEDLLDHHFSCQKEILVLRNIPPAKAYNMKPKEMASYHRRQAKYASL